MGKNKKYIQNILKTLPASMSAGITGMIKQEIVAKVIKLINKIYCQ